MFLNTCNTLSVVLRLIWPCRFVFIFLVDSFLTNQMEKFTGADLTEICQRAAKIAIRENIMKVGAAPCPAVPWLLYALAWASSITIVAQRLSLACGGNDNDDGIRTPCSSRLASLPRRTGLLSLSPRPFLSLLVCFVSC